VRIDGASSASISDSALRHWMQSVAGSDFREAVGAQGPRGFVSEPADYPRCLAAAKLVGPRSFFNQLRPGRAYLNRTCHTLYHSVKAQALGFLIAAKWAEVEGEERGIKLSEADVQQAFTRSRGQRYPTEGDLHRYLAERQWSLADLLYRLKHELLLERLGSSSVTAAGRMNAKMLARTRCADSDLVPGCSAYRGPATVSPTPEAILRHLVRPG
jgi:hypothetical protein